MNKKKWIGMLVLLVAVILIGGYLKKPVSIKDAFPELDTAGISTVVISTHDRVNGIYLDSKDRERFIAIVDNLVMKKKLIPNLPAFTTDAYLIFKSGEDSYTIKFDYARNIIGISKNRKRMHQYILEENSEFFAFVNSFL